jgi:hypothetical protein
MTAETAMTTRQKALELNLDAKRYGTFAEIGGGQEVARWFFSVGGAAGTVAKTISANDMAVSDGLYGPAKRYVSRQRLEARDPTVPGRALTLARVETQTLGLDLSPGTRRVGPIGGEARRGAENRKWRWGGLMRRWTLAVMVGIVVLADAASAQPSLPSVTTAPPARNP